MAGSPVLVAQAPALRLSPPQPPAPLYLLPLRLYRTLEHYLLRIVPLAPAAPPLRSQPTLEAHPLRILLLAPAAPLFPPLFERALQMYLLPHRSRPTLEEHPLRMLLLAPAALQLRLQPALEHYLLRIVLLAPAAP